MRKKYLQKTLGATALTAVVALCFAPVSAFSVQAAASCPAQVLDLSNWKQTLPIGKKKKPAEIEQPTLANYSADPYFHINPSGNGIICRAPVNGVTTSNSGYPRSELREMTNNGTKEASWSTTSGTHTMYIDQAITSVPKTKKHVVAGQIHDSDDDVIVVRLEYPKLFVDINGKTGPTLDSNYTLGKRFTVKFVAENGQIKIFYNGSSNPAYTLAKKSSGNYFKAGAYTQSNCSKESDCSDNNYGEVEIYALNVQHSTSTTPPAPTPVPTPTPTPVPTPQENVFEAESGLISGGMQILEDPSASEGKYVLAQSSGSVKYQINVPETGTYRVAGWIEAANGSSDSFYVSMDGGSTTTWTLKYPTTSWTYDVHDGKTFSLSQGAHTLTLKYREKEAKIDKIVLVKQ